MSALLEQAQAKLDRAARQIDPRPIAPPFKLIGAAELHTLPPLTWRIHSVLPRTGCASIIGASGSGKSFITLDMAAKVAEGERWFGYRTKPCRVVIVVLEGEAGFRRRVRAWETENGRTFPSAVLFLFQPFRLTNRDDVLNLAAAIAAADGADIILIDTLNRAAPEADENASRDMGLILEGLKDLQSMTGGVIVPVHHVGKDASKGMRGHSSLHAALDAVIEVNRTDAGREFRIAKGKDAEDGSVHPFRLQVVDLGADEDGEPVTSCVVVPEAIADRGAHRPRLPKGGNQRIVYDALGPLFRESTAFGKAGAPAIRPCIRLDDAIASARDRLTVESARRTERTRQAITGLISSGVMGHNEGWLWLI